MNYQNTNAEEPPRKNDIERATKQIMEILLSLTIDEQNHVIGMAVKTIQEMRKENIKRCFSEADTINGFVGNLDAFLQNLSNQPSPTLK